jgi:hypothetical protein
MPKIPHTKPSSHTNPPKNPHTNARHNSPVPRHANSALHVPQLNPSPLVPPRTHRTSKMFESSSSHARHRSRTPRENTTTFQITRAARRDSDVGRWLRTKIHRYARTLLDPKQIHISSERDPFFVWGKSEGRLGSPVGYQWSEPTLSLEQDLDVAQAS